MNGKGGERMNKNIWIIPLILLILLSAAGIFRWDKEPVQSFEKTLKVQAFKDRWTGQTWVEINGSIPGRLRKEWSYNWAFNDVNDDRWYLPGDRKDTDLAWENILRGININSNHADYHAGELFPYFSNAQVNKKAKEIKNSNIGRSKLNELNDAKAEAQSIKDFNSKGHTQYLVLDKSGSYIPSDIETACKEWRIADKQLKKIDDQISSIQLWYKSESLKELTKQAESTKTSTTIILCK